MILLTLLLGCTGEDWSLVADQFGDGVLLSAWSDGDTVLFAGGDMAGGPGVMATYDGDTVCTRSDVTERALWWVHGHTAGNWWAVGEAGTVLHHDNGTETREDIDTEATLFGVWATTDDVWAVGGVVSTNTGEIWRKPSGEDWTLVAGDIPGLVFKVWNGWFVGHEVGYQWNGTELVEAMPGERLLTVRGREGDDVWAVGGTASARVMHFEDGAWTQFDATGLGQPLNGVWTAPGETVWVAGNFGTAAYWDDETASWAFSNPPVTSEHFHAVWKHEDDVLFAGGNLFSPGNNYGTIARYGPGKSKVSIEACE